MAIKNWGTPAAAAISSSPVSGDRTVTAGSGGTIIGAQLVNARAEGIMGTDLLVTTTRGILNSGDAKTDTTCADVSACTLTTRAAEADDNDPATTEDPAGIVQVRLTGNGSTGTAQVTFRDLASNLSRTVAVVLHGTPASISAEVDQGTIGIGGSTFIVVTIVDADGNPTVGSFANVESGKPLTPAKVPPEVPAGSAAIIVDHSLAFDRNLPGTANDVPACNDQVNADPTPDADPDDGDPSEGNIGANPGTNIDGKCVIQVSAPGGGTPADATDDASRGGHTVTVKAAALGSASDEVTLTISVGGAPTSITSDAPVSVDPLSTTKITYTVLDDQGVRVGAVSATLDQIDGSGKVTAGESTAMTADGQRSFTYRAPSSAGTAVFLVTVPVGDSEVAHEIVVAIGAAADAAPAAISLDLRTGGRIYAVTAEGPSTMASALFGDAVTSAWKYNQDTGAWDVVYIPGRSGNFSIATGDILFVSSPIDQTVGG